MFKNVFKNRFVKSIYVNSHYFLKMCPHIWLLLIN